MNKQTLFFLIIAFLALFFRFSRFSTYPLGFDQVQILQNAEKIKNGEDFTKEICRVTIHGILHLLGYDHPNDSDEKEMEEKEENYLKAILK